jgi:hypothetical protein
VIDMAKPKRTILQSDTLGELADGLVGRIVNRELEAIHADMNDRGGDGKPRTLTLKLTFTPDENGVVDVKANVTKKLPDMVPPRTMAKTSKAAGGLVFHPENAANPDQTTFGDLEREEAERG